VSETVLEAPGLVGVRKPTSGTVPRNSQSTARGYLLLILVIGLGFLLREHELISPEEGIGYWLGIFGGVLMLTLLLYPLRKRIRILHVLGPTRSWFRIHMLFGLVGPLLILYHSNFRLGSVNSQVALYSMLLVAGSGIIGRHFYARIHRGLYGKKTSLKELQIDLSESVEKSHGLAKLMPHLVSKLERMSAEMQGCQITQSLGIGRSLRWTFSHAFVRMLLLWTARAELQAAAKRSEVVARDYKRLSMTASRYIREYTSLVGRVAQFSFYERLFALWHVLHLPIFLMMIVSALTHVLAVHMY
jgi:hypothetical protein